MAIRTQVRTACMTSSMVVTIFLPDLVKANVITSPAWLPARSITNSSSSSRNAVDLASQQQDVWNPAVIIGICLAVGGTAALLFLLIGLIQRKYLTKATDEGYGGALASTPAAVLVRSGSDGTESVLPGEGAQSGGLPWIPSLPTLSEQGSHGSRSRSRSNLSRSRTNESFTSFDHVLRVVNPDQTPRRTNVRRLDPHSFELAELPSTRSSYTANTVSPLFAGTSFTSIIAGVPQRPGIASQDEEHAAYTPSNYRAAPPGSLPRTHPAQPPSLPQAYSSASLSSNELYRGLRSESSGEVPSWAYLSAEDARGGAWTNWSPKPKGKHKRNR